MSLDDIKTRVEAATPGPWKSERNDGYDHINGDVEYFTVTGPEMENDEADAEFIAAARTDVPKLIEAIEAIIGSCDEHDAAWMREVVAEALS